MNCKVLSVSAVFMALTTLLAAGRPKFPGFKSTDRAALEAAAENGTNLGKLRARVRLAQLDTPKETSTYEKQSRVIRREMEKLGLTDEGLVFSMPLMTPDGKEIWPMEGWRDAHAAGDYREMMYLVNTVSSMTNVRAELGDKALFRCYAGLLKNHFGKYSQGVVDTAVKFMSRLTKSVPPADVVTHLSQVRARVVLKAEKDPAKWGKTLSRIDDMIAKAVKASGVAPYSSNGAK